MIDIGLLLNSKRLEMSFTEIDITPEYVIDFRHKYSLSKTALANLLGVSRKTIYNWERGSEKIKGSGAILLWLLGRHPELIQELRNVEIKEAGEH